MSTVIRLFSLVFCLAFIFGGCTTSNPIESNPIENPHFYKITKRNETHYILGTFHYVAHWSDFPSYVHEAFKSSVAVVLEIEMDESDRRMIKLKMSDLKTRPLPKMKKEHIEKLRQLEIPEKLFPHSGSESAEFLIFARFRKELPYYLLDVDIYFQAKDAKKKTLALDTPTLIKESKRHGPSHTIGITVAELLDSMTTEELRAWGQRNVDNYWAGPAAAKPSTDGGIIYRNKRWLPVLLKYFKQQNQSFVAVGAAHLYGKDGLIELLKTKGYTVTLVKK